MTRPYYIKRDNKWHVRVLYFGKIIPIGYYKTQEEAIKHHNEAQVRYFGNEARLLHYERKRTEIHEGENPTASQAQPQQR